MERIESFKVDHRHIKEGIYISRKDRNVTTYDIRATIPNTQHIIDNETMHSIEHLFATIARNSEIKDDVLYFGPMGCQTGFYLLVFDANDEVVYEKIKQIFNQIANYNGQMPGCSEIECGNYKTLNIEKAKKFAYEFYQKIKNKSVDEINY